MKNSMTKTVKQQISQPLVSIIVPVYGVEKYLQKCINSLVMQNFQNIEIILVDDGSKDGSGEICNRNAQRYPNLITVIHQANTGLGGARNTGIRAAHGRYIMFVDSDDYIHPDTVGTAYDVISRKNVDMVAFGVNFVTEDGRILRVKYDGSDFGKVLHPASNPSLILNVPNAWNKIYRSNLFSEHDIWFPSRAWYEDIRTTMKIYAVIDSVIYIQEAFYYYVQRKESIMHSSNIERNEEIIDAFDDIFEYYDDKQLTDIYHDELEQLTILNVYMAASGRVAALDAKHHLLPLFRDYLKQHFPKYNQNKYTPGLNKKRRTLLFFLEIKQYRLVKVLGLLKSSLEN